MPSTVKEHLDKYIAHYPTAIDGASVLLLVTYSSVASILLETIAIVLVLDMCTTLHLHSGHTLRPLLAAGTHSCLALNTLLCAAASRKLQTPDFKLFD